MNEKADFRKNLRSVLDSRNLTVKELSVITGVAKGTLDCYLGARASMPPADVAAKIAATLGVTIEYLLSGRELKKQENHIATIIQLLVELTEKDQETILTLSRILKTQAGENKY